MTRRLQPSIRLTALSSLLAALLLSASLTGRALETEKPLKQYGRQSWQSDTGLPQNTVHSIVQSRDGYIWMATEGGLVRFDGQDLRTFDTTNTRELPSDSINSLAVDEQNTLWISTASGLVRLEGGRFTTITTANGLPSDLVNFVYPLHDGRTLAATANGLALRDAKGFHALPGITSEIAPEQIAEDSLVTLWIGSGQQLFSIPHRSITGSAQPVTEAGEIRAIAAGAPGDLWIGGNNGIILLRNGKRVTLNPGNTTLNVTALLPMPNGDLWIGSDSGLFEYTHGALKRLGEPHGITAGRVLSLFRDREGSVWVAYDLGVARVLPSGQLQDPLDIPGVLSIFEDRESDMWFGTDVGGATVLREQAFSTLTAQDGLSDDFIRAIFQDHAGTIWMGTNRGGLNRIAQGKITAVRATNGAAGTGLSSNVVLALAESQGDLWVGTPDGLSRLHNDQLKLFTTADGLPDDFVRSLYTDRDGSLWIGTRNGLSHYANGRFISYSRLDGLGSDLIGGILRTHDGTLWVGTLNGLSRFDGSSFKNFTVKNGLGTNAITTLAEDHEGTLWIASHASGLTRLRGGVFASIASAKVGLPEEIYSILEAQSPESSTPGLGWQTSLWLSSSRGIFRIALDSLNAFADRRTTTLPVQSFGTADGMKISECSSGGHPAAWRMSDGTLWFATLKGAASIHPASNYGSRIAPLTAIEDVLIDDQPAAQNQPLIVPPGRERITIHYAGLSFRAPQKLRFRYKLEGFDREWIDAGVRRTAFYTNIPAGSYRFVVFASNGDGIWSEVPGELRFTVRPHFYQTIWFYCLALLFATFIAWLIYRSRVRTVELQYQAVLAERNRIAREIHDTLAQGYVGISVQLEVASRLLQISKEAASQQLENTKEYVRSSLADARSSIWNLRSPGAESETLSARLAAAVTSRQQSPDAATTLRFDVHGAFRPVDQHMEDEFLKIALEAIHNALRHASAKTITVALSYDTNWLKLSVTDDGTGFEPASIPSGHYGVKGMRERAEGIDARLEIKSKQGTGTIVELTGKLPGRKAAP